MPPAARFLEFTSHPGLLLPGPRNVLINGLPAACTGDLHVCLMPPTAGPHPPSPVGKGSATVLITGMPAARQFDSTGCGATILNGSPNVIIGG
jgi:uncharacterized Zn-binding protein involved in type VI secretion